MSNEKRRLRTGVFIAIIGLVSMVLACYGLPRILGVLVCPGIPVFGSMGIESATPSTVSENQFLDGYVEKSAGFIQLGRGRISDLALSSDDGTLVIASANSLQAVNTSTYEYEWEGRLPIQISAISVSPDSALVAVGGVDGTVYLLDLTDGEKIAVQNELLHTVQELNWSGDSTTLAILTEHPRDFIFWEIDNDVLWQTVQADSVRMKTMSWSPDDAQFVSAWENDITIWSTRARAPLNTIRISSQRIVDIQDIHWLPATSLFAVGGSNHLLLFDANTGEEVASLEADIGANITEVDSSQDGTFLLAATTNTVLSEEGGVWNSYNAFLWHCNHGEFCSSAPVLELPEAGGHVALSSNSEYLYAASGSQIRAIERESASSIATLSGYSERVTSLTFDSSGKYLAVGTSEGVVSIWDTETTTLLQQYHEHNGAVSALAWSPIGHRLASVGSSDNRLIVWDTMTGELGFSEEGFAGNLEEPSGMVDVMFSKDGKWLSTTDFIADTIWEVTTSQSVCRVPDRRLLLAISWESPNQIIVPYVNSPGAASEFAVTSDDETKTAIALEDGRVLLLAPSTTQ